MFGIDWSNQELLLLNLTNLGLGLTLVLAVGSLLVSIGWDLLKKARKGEEWRRL